MLEPNSSSLPLIPRYGIAVLSVCIALALAVLLREFNLQIPLLMAAIATAVWFGTALSGLLAIVLSMAGLACLFLPAVHSVELGAIHVLYFIAFTLFASVISCLNKMRHGAEEWLWQAGDKLDMKMDELTAVLRQTGPESETNLDLLPLGIALPGSE